MGSLSGSFGALVLEFIKTTFMIALPVIFIFGYAKRRTKYSLPWIIAVMLMLLFCGFYISRVLTLPERVATKSIVRDGISLVAEGKYEAAENRFKELEVKGELQEFEKRMAVLNNERNASINLDQAKQLIEKGDYAEAERILKLIPRNTRAGQAAREIKIP